MFTDFSLCPELQTAVRDLGFTEPTPDSKPRHSDGARRRDLLAAAQTGTGKTAAFALPLLERLRTSGDGSRRPRALVLVPTRELAAQVSDTFRVLARHLPLRGALIFGGVSPKPQLQALAHGVDVIIATPGRVLDHLQSRALDLSRASRCWCSMRPTACWIWASSRRCAASSPHCPSSGRH